MQVWFNYGKEKIIKSQHYQENFVIWEDEKECSLITVKFKRKETYETFCVSCWGYFSSKSNPVCQYRKEAQIYWATEDCIIQRTQINWCFKTNIISKSDWSHQR